MEPSVFRKIMDSMRWIQADEPTSAAADLLGSQGPQFRGYRLVRELGRGGFARVFLARDETLERDVALKVLPVDPAIEPKARERFLTEARALARVSHRNVLAIHGVVEEGPWCALSTELIQGRTLADLLEEKGRFSAEESARIGVEACRALAAVHARGIVHRDVKTANILREEGGRIVLADFGLGAFLDKRANEEQAAEGRTIAGSPLFMSPEQARGDALDRRTDLYSLGVVLFNLASGQFPCSATDTTELFERINKGQFERLRDVRPDLPEAFVSTVTRALRVDPGDRFQSAGEMEEALLACMDARRLPEQAAPAIRWNAPRLLVALVALILLAVVGVWSSWSATQSTNPKGIGGQAPGHLQASIRFFLDGNNDKIPLKTGDRVTEGDQVFVEIESPWELYAYALNEDETGTKFLLYPLPGGERRNPLPGGRRHRLPGRMGGREIDWVRSMPGSREWLCVVASREPIAVLEELAARGPQLMEREGIQYPRLEGREEHRLLRSFGEVAPARQSAQPQPWAGLRSFLESVRGDPEGAVSTRGILVESIVLDGS